MWKNEFIIFVYVIYLRIFKLFFSLENDVRIVFWFFLYNWFIVLNIGDFYWIVYSMVWGKINWVFFFISWVLFEWVFV